MNAQMLRDICWIGEEYVQGPVRGIVLSFHGLGGGGGKTEAAGLELEFAAAGGLVVYPYYGPWSWMNRRARAMVDDLVDAVIVKYSLPDGAPIVCTGGSMGGLSALLYTRYARRSIRACYANCPVCDLRYHFTERPDLPPTLRCAAGYPDDMEPYFRQDSPLEQVAGLPDVPYLIVHGERDRAVSKVRHSDVMVAAMRGRGLRVEYIEVPKMSHCGLLPLTVARRIADFVRAALG